MRKRWVATMSISVAILIYMAWSSRDYLKLSMDLSEIISIAILIIASHVIHSIKWGVITGDFSISNLLSYNSSQIFVLLPAPVQDPARMAVLKGRSGEKAANIVWDRATDAISLALVSVPVVLYSTQAFRKLVAVLLATAGVVALMIKPINRLLSKIVPRDLLDDFRKSVRKRPMQTAASIAAGVLFWTMNIFPASIIIRSVAGSGNHIRNVSATAFSFFVSAINPLPMGVGSTELMLSIATGVAFGAAVSSLLIYRVFAYSLQIISSVATILIGRGARGA